MILGKVQITLVWNSRNENSPGSDKLNALANVSLLLPFFFCFYKFPASSLLILEIDGPDD